MGRPILRRDESPVPSRRLFVQAVEVEAFVLGLICAAGAYLLLGVRDTDDGRRRRMTEAQALGYRAALGENPATMRMRRTVDPKQVDTVRGS